EEKGAGAPKGSGGGEVVLQVDAKLTNQDPMDKGRAGRRAKVHAVRLSAGQTYQIDMVTREKNRSLGAFDPYLRLEDSTGHKPAKDDDRGGSPTARIAFRCHRDPGQRVAALTACPRGRDD